MLRIQWKLNRVLLFYTTTSPTCLSIRFENSKATRSVQEVIDKNNKHDENTEKQVGDTEKQERHNENTKKQVWDTEKQERHNGNTEKQERPNCDTKKPSDQLDSFILRIQSKWSTAIRIKSDNLFKYASSKNRDGGNYKSHNVSNEKSTLRILGPNNRTKDPAVSSVNNSIDEKNSVINIDLLRLSEKAESLLCEILENVQVKKNKEELKDCLRQNVIPSFKCLLHTCAELSKSNKVDILRMLQELTQMLYPKQFKENLCFNYYLACSLCYDGQVEAGLAELRLLYNQVREQQPEYKKNVANVANIIIYNLVAEAKEEHQQLMLSFVNTVAKEVKNLGPALTLWRATFCSHLYTQQKIADSLLEQHPKMAIKLDRKVPGMVGQAVHERNEDLLRKILQLILQLQLEQHYHNVTASLLQLQCDLDDIGAAEETLKFSQRLGIRLPPAAVARMLALLARHSRPAPMSLLSQKYQPKSSETPKSSKIPKFKFKF